MLELLKKPALTRKQRFTKALVVGGATSVASILLKIFIASFFKLNISFLYLIIGFLIGQAIQRFAKGVQVQFSIAAAAFTFVTIIICDFVTYGGLSGIRVMLTSIIDVAIRILSVYVAYYYARVI